MSWFWKMLGRTSPKFGQEFFLSFMMVAGIPSMLMRSWFGVFWLLGWFVVGCYCNTRKLEDGGGV